MELQDSVGGGAAGFDESCTFLWILRLEPEPIKAMPWAGKDGHENRNSSVSLSLH